jgi:flagellar biosynthesis/type III secretory pathway protein FliH
MPGPGQGKRAHKKKWRENASSLNANIATVNTVTTASSTSALHARMATLTTLPPSDVTTTAEITDERPQDISSHTATQPTTTTTTADAATHDANDETCVDTATAASPTNEPFTYSHEEVQQLLEDARLDGYQEGFEQGHRVGRKTGREEGKEDGYNEGYEEGSRKWIEGHEAGYEAGKKMGKEKEETARKNGQLEGYELGTQDGKEEERKKWLTEGHGAGLCLTMAAHACELFRGAVLLEEAETQTDDVTTNSVDVQTTPAVTTTVNVSTHAAPTTIEMAIQTNPAHERRCAALQTEPPDDECSTTMKNAETRFRVDLSIRTTLRTNETATQTEDTPQPTSLTPITHHDPRPNAATSPSTTATVTVATTPKTTTWATSSTQTTTTTSERTTQAVNDVQRRSTAQQTTLREDEQTCSSKRVEYSTEPPCRPHHPQRQSRTPPTPPCTTQLVPPIPVAYLQPPTNVATSSSTRTSTLAVSPALPPSATGTTAQERRDMLPDPSERPHSSFQPPSSPQTPCKRTVSPPTASHTSATSPSMRLSTMANPCILPHSGQQATARKRRNTVPDSSECTRNLSQPPSPPQTPRERVVSPPPVSSTTADASESPATTVLRPPSLVEPPLSSVQPRLTPVPSRFDWAEDAASIPIVPSSYTRDLSSLRTRCLQPFRTLRRRAPPHFFSQSRKSSYPALPLVPQSQVQFFITRRHPSGIGPGKPIITIPFGTTSAPAPVPKLNWDQDPRLVDLSRALRALGWTPPC